MMVIPILELLIKQVVDEFGVQSLVNIEVMVVKLLQLFFAFYKLSFFLFSDLLTDLEVEIQIFYQSLVD